MLVKRLFYPVVMAGSLLGYWALLKVGVPLAIAPYLAVALFGPLVLLGERAIPYRPEWSPAGRDLAIDAIYLAAVQVALPFGLAWTVVLGIQGGLRSAGLVWNLWPSDWPLWAQLVLKVGIGDFLRYWLHRSAHTWNPLWRLHAVHHAPEKLYTTNVFRFHPAEKVLQFACDTLPFALIGVGPEVFAAYFVFYSMSGLFQHSNCDVRLGWLNFVVSGPEVHRWHHSKVVAESNANYAHSFVGWDLLFGTYLRPKGRVVDELGLMERNYPSGFLGQMIAPFRPRRLVTRSDEAH